MIPTITDLNKEKLTVANDIENVAPEMAPIVSVMKAPANDKMTMLKRPWIESWPVNNGHKKRYRNARGQYTTKEKAAANDKVDAVGQTIDRIMGRHNDHENAPGRMDASNENRIIHDAPGDGSSGRGSPAQF
jgi:hypothetical protein